MSQTDTPKFPKQVTVATPEKVTLLTRLIHFWQQLTRQGPYLTLLEGIDQITRMITGAPTRRFSVITPEVHLGGQYRSYGWPLLVKRGITAVVNMRSEFSDRRSNITPQHYLHLPTIDNTPPSLEQLRQGADFIKGEIANSGKVYVHCWEGVGRGPTMVTAYLVSTGLSPDEAWKRIRDVRPFIRPTEAQVAQVERFAADLKQQAEATLAQSSLDEFA
jgi:predicted protein tyrosine phosphatase